MSDTKSNIKTFFALLFIFILGLILRLIFIEKLEGLWNDEYLSWQIASIPLGGKFLKAVVEQCHMPFYYLYLKFFIHFLGNSDLMLRLTSVLSGVLAIIAMFFAGKELKNEKLGLLSALFTALSSFLIYFSQEVRIYGLLFLFSSLSLIFSLKLIKRQSVSNVIFYIISNLLIICTHTLGFIFVFFNLVYISYTLKNTYKKQIIMLWTVLGLLTVIGIPHILKIFSSNTYSQWWDSFSMAKIGFLLTDYFSPVLTNIVSSPSKFFANFSLKFVVFGLVPTLIALLGLIKAIKSKKIEIIALLWICAEYLLVLMLASMFGKLVFLTKYSIEIYPILIIAVSYGLLEYGKKFRTALIILFCFLSLFYIICTKNSAPKMHRAEGHKIVADLLKRADLHQGDVIIINYYPQNRFEKYFDFSDYKVISINKGNFNEYLSNIGSYPTLKDGKNLYREIFKNSENETFTNKFSTDILNNLKHGQKICIITLNTVARYTPEEFDKIVHNDKIYKKSPFLFLAFSEIKNLMVKESWAHLQIRRYEEKGSWAAFTFEKQ